MKNCIKPVDRMTDIPYTEPRPIKSDRSKKTYLKKILAQILPNSTIYCDEFITIQTDYWNWVQNYSAMTL